MNAQDYISSGLLEAYVLGSLPDSEKELVLGAMCRFQEVKDEVAILESVLFAAAQEDAVAPPPALEASIWAAIEKAPTAEATNNQGEPLSKNISLEVNSKNKGEMEASKSMPLSGKSGLGNWARAAVWIALVGSLVGNYSLWTGRNEDRKEVAVMQQKMQGMEAEQTALNTKISRYTHEAEMAAQPGIQPVVMSTTQPDHPMAVTIYWDKSAQEGFVSVQKLPPAPEGMQYQLWAIADGKPKSIGMLDNSVAENGGMQKVPDAIISAQAFAVSLEKEGGNENPTPGKICVMGKVPS